MHFEEEEFIAADMIPTGKVLISYDAQGKKLEYSQNISNIVSCCLQRGYFAKKNICFFLEYTV